MLSASGAPATDSPSSWPNSGRRLVDAFGRRSVFLIAVPLGLATIGLALRVVPELRDPGGRHLDVPGQLCGAIALGGLALAGIDAARDARVAVVALLTGTIAVCCSGAPSGDVAQRRWCRSICFAAGALSAH